MKNNAKRNELYENKDVEDVLLELLQRSNNPQICPIRAEFRKIEDEIISTHIMKTRGSSKYNILYAGSGLGYELMNQPFNGLYAKEIVGIEKSRKLCELSREYISKSSMNNISIIEGDFFEMPFQDGQFNYTVLNCGTIGNFKDRDKKMLIKELLRVTNDCVMIDFYGPNSNQKRLKMYVEEGMSVPVIDGNTIRNDDLGLSSEAMTLNKFERLFDSSKLIHRGYVRMEDFGWMAKIYASRK